MTAVDSLALLAAFAAGLVLMLLAPLAPPTKREEAKPEISPETSTQIFWPALCGIETTDSTVEMRLGLARQLASRSDVRAAAIRRAALTEEPDQHVRTALQTLSPAIGEP